MFKKTLSFIIALIMLFSATSVTMLSVSAESATDVSATADEATADEAKLVITDEPNVDKNSVEGTVIGYIGDANLDDKINIKDATAVQKHLAKIIVLSQQAMVLSDTDNNGKLNVRDATTIQKYIAGIVVNSKIKHLLYETGAHKHNYIDTVVEPKCEENGYTLHSCICGDELKDTIVPVRGHNYTHTKVKSTCVDKGYTLHECKYCKHSYKDEETPATGDHNYKNYVCSECGVKKSVEAFETLKSFIKNKGYYESNVRAYYYEINPVQKGDGATLAYSKDDDAILIICYYFMDDYLDVISVAITADGECSFYMLCQDAYESAGYIDMSKFTMDSKKVKEIDYYMISDIKESAALANTVAYIKGALATYEYNSKLPVTIQDLGFTSYK